MTRMLFTVAAVGLGALLGLTSGHAAAQGGDAAPAAPELRTVEVAITNCRDDDVELQLVPVDDHALGLRPARTRWLPAGETRRVWIPRRTARLEAPSSALDRTVLGAVEVRDGDRFVLR